MVPVAEAAQANSAIQGCSIQNEYDLNGQRSVGANDIPHYFVGSLVYDVPFGRGRNTLRPDNVYRFDLSLFKEIAVTEGLRVQIRTEAFNAFNSTMFSNPDANLASIRFGLVTSAQVPPREYQMGLKILS